MKYIRVYEGYYEQEYITTYQEHCEYVAGLQDSGFDFEGCVVKQADTIEELCDVYVKKSREVGNDYFEVGKDAFEVFDRKYQREDLEHYDYYGAIWTDKGLIYVAKMNNEGELELL